MPKHVVDINILREEYDAFVRLSPEDNCFPGTYDEWLTHREKENAKHRARGNILDNVVIHAQEFIDYARTTGQPLSQVTLQATAVKKLRGQK